MNDFWKNIFRYPRFLVSSVVGSILVILTPVRNLFKTPKLRIFLVCFVVSFIILLYLILENMLAL